MFRSLRTRLLALLVGTVAALALAEVALRIMRPAPLDVVRYPCIYEPDEVLGFRYVPGASGRVAAHFEIDNPVEMNGLGFYDDDPLAAEQADPRVLAVGDSFTAAMNVPREAVWTAVLERELRQRLSSRADVVNLGLDGTGTDIHLALLRRHAPALAPDIVILAFYGNDFHDVLNGRFGRECHRGYVLSYQSAAQRQSLRAEVDAHHARPVARWLFDHSFVVRAFHLLDGRRDPFHIEFLQETMSEMGITDEVRRGRMPRLAASFRGLRDFARGCGCRVVVVPVPSREDPGGTLRILQGIVQSRGLEVFDPLPAMDRAREADGRGHEDLYFVHDAHFNAYGNVLYGRAVADFIIAQASRGSVQDSGR